MWHYDLIIDLLYFLLHLFSQSYLFFNFVVHKYYYYIVSDLFFYSTYSLFLIYTFIQFLLLIIKYYYVNVSY